MTGKGEILFIAKNERMLGESDTHPNVRYNKKLPREFETKIKVVNVYWGIQNGQRE